MRRPNFPRSSDKSWCSWCEGSRGHGAKLVRDAASRVVQEYQPRLAALSTRRRHFHRCSPFEQVCHLSDFSKHMLPKKPDTCSAPKIPVVEQPQTQVVLCFWGTESHQ
jgi:hypothetical protein